MNRRSALGALTVTLAALLVFGCEAPKTAAPAAPQTTIVIVVRHAEKASQEADAPLTDAGRTRADALADAAAGAGISAVYTSQFSRSKDTAHTLVERLGVAPTELPVDLGNPGDYSQRIAADILAHHAGETVLVVGHQNTIPTLVDALAGHAASRPFADTEYDRLTIVEVTPGRDARVIIARYGAPSE